MRREAATISARPTNEWPRLRAAAGLGCVLLAALLLAGGCAGPRDEVVYRPVWRYTLAPLSREQALSRKDYVAAYYDTAGRIYRRDIFIHGERVIEETIEYHANGNPKTFKLVRSDGKTRIFRYDEQGEMIGP